MARWKEFKSCGTFWILHFYSELPVKVRRSDLNCLRNTSAAMLKLEGGRVRVEDGESGFSVVHGEVIDETRMILVVLVRGDLKWLTDCI